MVEKKNLVRERNIGLVTMIEVALMAAITFVATSAIHIPSFNGVIHAGDSIVFVSAYFLGKKKGAAASAIGMFLFDVVHGYLTWAPFTLVIKGVMALIAAYIIRDKEESNIIRNGIAFLVAGTFMILAYFLSGALIKLLFTSEAIGIREAFIVSSYDIPGNILQVLVGMAIALPLIQALKGTLKRR